MLRLRKEEIIQRLEAIDQCHSRNRNREIVGTESDLYMLICLRDFYFRSPMAASLLCREYLICKISF